MGNKKHLLCFMLVLLLLLTSCSDALHTDEAGDAEVTEEKAVPDSAPSVILLRYTGADGSAGHLGALRFKEHLEDVSNGAFSVEIYSEAAMGSAGDVEYALRYGTITMHIGEPLFPILNCLAWPAISGDIESMRSLVNEGEIARLIAEESAQRGVQFLGIVSSEYYVVNSTYPLRSLSDLQNLVLASAIADGSRGYWSGVGASTTLCLRTQAFTALQEGVANAQEDILHANIVSRLSGHINYVLLTNHRIENRVVYMNSSFYNNLSAEEQQMIGQTVLEVREYLDSYIANSSTNILSRLEENGIMYQPPSPALQKALDESVYQPLIDSLGNIYGVELMETILQTLSA